MGAGNGKVIPTSDVPKDALAVDVGAKIEKPAKTGPAAMTTGARAEVLAVCTMAIGAAQCDAVRVVIYGEEILRLPASDPNACASSIVNTIEEDATGREAGMRHVYSVGALRGDVEAYKGVVRVTGGGLVAGPNNSVAQLDGSPVSIIKQAQRHTDAAIGHVVRSHTMVTGSLERELDRKTARVDKLEAEVDRLRGELRTALEQGKADAARAETERMRMAMLNQIGAKLLSYIPDVLGTWFPIEEGKGEKGGAKKKRAGDEERGKPAPKSILQALASITDDQLGQVRAVLTATQVAIVERARGGEVITVGDVLEVAELSDEATHVLPTVLRPDQTFALLEGFQSIKPREGA